MAINIAKREIQSISDIQNKYPNAFKYLMSKNPTSIGINGWDIELYCVASGQKLIYDQDDIKYFNRLHELINLTPAPLDIDFSGFVVATNTMDLDRNIEFAVYCENNKKILNAKYYGNGKWQPTELCKHDLNVTRVKLD